VPDPQDPATFECSKLDWAEADGGFHAEMWAWYRKLIVFRRCLPDLTEPRRDRLEVSYDEQARWLLVKRSDVLVAANLEGSWFDWTSILRAWCWGRTRVSRSAKPNYLLPRIRRLFSEWLGRLTTAPTAGRPPE
jgi:1,4-alpha-glucan branching enzyme